MRTLKRAPQGSQKRQQVFCRLFNNSSLEQSVMMSIVQYIVLRGDLNWPVGALVGKLFL